MQSGKSSFIQYFDKRALNVQAKGRDDVYYTVGMDMGSLKLNGFEVFLFGTPGLLRFSVMRDVILDGADGIIFMFDAIHPEKDEKAISILNSIRTKIKPETPIIYLFNKQDVEGARPAEVVKIQNNLPEDSKVFPTSVKNGINMEEALKYIVNKVYDNYKEMIEILRDYEENIKGLAGKLSINKEQMRNFLNSFEIKRFIAINRRNKTYKVRKGLKNLI